MDKQYWVDLAADYDAAAVKTSLGKTRTALLLAMAVAEHETLNGRAWPGSNNFGAVQLRQLTADEHARFAAGTLKAGDKFEPPAPGQPGGVLHVDTHPTKVKDDQGNLHDKSVPYPVWFAYFPERVDGVAFFLKALWRLSGGAPDAAGATPYTVALAMYRHGYYEGFHGGARPVGQRSDPLTTPEQQNVDDYSKAVTWCFAGIRLVLADWATIAVGSDDPYFQNGPGTAAT